MLQYRVTDKDSLLDIAKMDAEDYRVKRSYGTLATKAEKAHMAIGRSMS